MIELKQVSKIFPTSEGDFQALKDVSLTIRDGDIFGIVGMSGAGKSTLVRCINLLERPTSGQVLMDGEDLMTFSPARLRQARRSIAMIFQQFNLLMQRTCLKNICFPMEIAGVPAAEAKKRALEYLDIVCLLYTSRCVLETGDTYDRTAEERPAGHRRPHLYVPLHPGLREVLPAAH